MPIENRDLKPGMKLVARYHKQQFACEVVEGEGEKVRYRLEDGREFKSPSAAGMAITGKSCNGWAFWSVETSQAAPVQETEKTEPANQLPAGQAEVSGTSATEEPGPTKKRIFRLPNQKGVTEGQTRWYCHDCGKSFLVATDETPKTCPAGHQAG